jgi:hypothetical protein
VIKTAFNFSDYYIEVEYDNREKLVDILQSNEAFGFYIFEDENGKEEWLPKRKLIKIDVTEVEE